MVASCTVVTALQESLQLFQAATCLNPRNPANLKQARAASVPRHTREYSQMPEDEAGDY